MLFSEVIVKNLRRRWARTLLTILGLAVAVTATTTSVEHCLGICGLRRRNSMPIGASTSSWFGQALPIA